MKRTGGFAGGGWVGAVVWFQIGDESQVTVDDLKKWHEELGLSTEFVPAATRGVDAFRVGVRELRSTSFDVVRGGKIRTVSLDSELAISNREELTHELIYRFGKGTTDTEVVGRITYFRPERNMFGNVAGTDGLEYAINDHLPAAERKKIEAAARGVISTIHHLREYLHAARLRDVVRAAVFATDAIIVGPQGMYWALDVDALAVVQQLVERIGGGSVMNILPLLDTPVQRDMLARGLNLQIRSDVASLRVLIGDAVSKSRGGSLTQSRQAALRGSYLDIVERSQRLSDRIGRPIGDDAVALVNALRDDFADVLDQTSPTRR